MENKKTSPASQQLISQQHLMAHHVHPEQIYLEQPTTQTHLPVQPPAPHHNITGGGMLQLINQYNSKATAHSPLQENRHELYGTGHIHDYTRHYGANDYYNYPQSPPQRIERTDLYMDHKINHELLHNIPKGYNAEVYHDYLKRNPPKDTNIIFQNHQPACRANMNQHGSKPYLLFSNRVGPQSNTELLRRQYNEIQQMKLQQQLHYENQAQMQQQQTFAERQLLFQKLHGVQPPPNLQYNIYSDGSYHDLNQYSSKSDIKEHSADIPKYVDKYLKNNECKEPEKPIRQYEESQWKYNHQTDIRNTEQYRRQSDGDNGKSQIPENCQSLIKNKVGLVSPMNSRESSSPSMKSPSTDSRRSSGGTQALRSPVAQRNPSAPVTLSGILYKQGSDVLKVWRKRWFVLAEYCLFYYKSQDEKKLLGSVLLPSYKVSVCTADDKVLKKFSFKLEHANVRSYVLAAPDQESMLNWMKVLTMAAHMHNPKYNSNSQGKSHTHYQEHINYPTSLNQESTFNCSPQSPPSPTQQPPHYQTKRFCNTQHLSLPLTNTITDRLKNQPTTTSISRYFDNINRMQNQPQPPEIKQEQIYECQSRKTATKETQNNGRSSLEQDKSKALYNETFPDPQNHSKSKANVSTYRYINTRPNQVPSSINEHLLIEKPDTYNTSVSMSGYSKGKIGDYEDVCDTNEIENKYGKTYSKSPPQARDVTNLQHFLHDYQENDTQENAVSGPFVLRRRKMQSSRIQSIIPRPHSADFLEYEAKNEMLNRSIFPRSAADTEKQPQRPKSSLDINSFYDPSSDRYYSEESYTEKMRQSALYLQNGMGARNIQIPLAKYASSIAEKQLNSPNYQNSNNNYETEFGVNRSNHDNVSVSKYCDAERLNCNWTMKEKKNHKYYRSGSEMSDSSNAVAFAKDLSRYDHSSEIFMRSASAHLPSNTTEKEGVKKVQQELKEEIAHQIHQIQQPLLQNFVKRVHTC